MTMKNTINRMNKAAGQAAKTYRDFEDIMRAGRTEYKNTAVEAANAEVHALRFTVEQLYTMLQEQQRTMGEMLMRMNAMDTQLHKGVQKGTLSVKRTVTEQVDVEYAVQSGDDDMAKEYRKGINILWSCGLSPIEIAFNEFDLYRREHNMYTMISPDDVRRISSSILNNSKKLTGMTLSKLLKEYAKQRKLNY